MTALDVFIDTENDGCPCRSFEHEGRKWVTHCWRTDRGCCCEFSGVHVSGDETPDLREQSSKLAKYINESWNTKTEINFNYKGEGK